MSKTNRIQAYPSGSGIRIHSKDHAIEFINKKKQSGYVSSCQFLSDGIVVNLEKKTEKGVKRYSGRLIF